MDIKVNGKDVPVVKAKAVTTLSNLKTGVKYKDEEEWKALGIDPKQIRRNVKITVPSLDLFAKTKQIGHSRIIMATNGILDIQETTEDFRDPDM